MTKSVISDDFRQNFRNKYMKFLNVISAILYLFLLHVSFHIEPTHVKIVTLLTLLQYLFKHFIT